MLFNSGAFLKFFSAFLLLYFIVRNRSSARNVLIVAASYLFYGWWDYRFLSLLIISSLLDFFVALGLERSQSLSKRRFLVSISVAGNLSILGFFKYFDFFAASLEDALMRFGFAANWGTLGVILPVGISFYTFQTMSYTIDVYRREVAATRDLMAFLAYVSFFPQLVAGPIERASRLLPQFGRCLTITTAMVEEGIWLCVWGMYKKVVLADNLAPLVEMVYGDEGVVSGPIILLATVAFGFQIYCDFSGYSDIARGVAKMLGFNLMTNFNLPYAAVNIREFWSRWHISLSTWLRDYLYISLGGNRSGSFRTVRNLGLTMLLGGLWHGAAWNFVLWGAWHGAGLVVYRLWSHVRSGNRIERDVVSDRSPNSRDGFLGRAAGWVLTMVFVFYGWLLFRAGSWTQVVDLTRGLANLSLPEWVGDFCLNLCVFTLPLVTMQIWQSKAGNLLVPMAISRWTRSLIIGGLLVAVCFSWEKEKVPFIYFQF